MMRFKQHQVRKPTACHDSGDHRMKLLLAVIDGPTKSGSLKVSESKLLASVGGGGGEPSVIVTPPALEKEAMTVPGRNLVTPTQDTRAPQFLPLARPPALASASMIPSRTATQHMAMARQGLKMPPSLRRTTGDGRGIEACNPVKHHHLPTTITVVKKIEQPIPSMMALRQCINPSLTRRISPATLPSQLHSVCCWANDHSDLATIVVDILTRDPMAIRRKCEVARLGSSSSTKMDCTFPFRRQRPRTEPYHFPLNLALQHQSKTNPNMQVLEIMVSSGPDILRMQDGRDGGGSLNVALRHHPQNLVIVQLLLRANPNCVKVADRRGNTPLHVACFQGSPLEVVEEVYQQDPAAIDKANISGDTPWQIIQRNSHQSSNSVAEFLFACTKRREGRMRKACS